MAIDDEPGSTRGASLIALQVFHLQDLADKSLRKRNLAKKQVMRKEQAARQCGCKSLIFRNLEINPASRGTWKKHHDEKSMTVSMTCS